ARPKIDLRFFTRTALHPPKRQLPLHAQPIHEPTDAVITAGETVIGHQVLEDALSAEPQIELRLNHIAPRSTVAKLTDRRSNFGFGIDLGTGRRRTGIADRGRTQIDAIGNAEPGGALAGFGSPPPSSEPGGALAGFESADARRMWRATVSRLMPSSRAIRRTDHRRACSESIVSTMTTLSRFAIVDLRGCWTHPRG